MRALRPIFTLLATGLLASAFLILRPFAGVNRLLDRAFGAPPEWTQVSSLHQDPLTQETSHGEQPVPSLTRLETWWAEHPAQQRVCLMGNSQMLAMSLAPGEERPRGPERTYTDLVTDRLRSLRSPGALVYRLAAPGLSFEESLWYAAYMVGRPGLRPNVIAIQVNYQAFWNGGIRDGMFAMLDDAGFRKRVREIAGSSRPSAESFGAALQKYEMRSAPKVQRTSSAPPGDALETWVRGRLLDRYPFSLRAENKDDLMGFLNRCRLYFLQIKPSTARSITGTRLWRSQAALEDLAALCRNRNVRLVPFFAPLNPAVSLYRSPADRRSYRDFTAAVASRYGMPLYDLEDAVPRPLWGRQLNSPDPLHLGRRGHALVAAKIEDILSSELAAARLQPAGSL